MNDVVRCESCGFQVLRRELDEFGNGPCCPSSTRVTRSDKGKTRKEVTPDEVGTKDPGREQVFSSGAGPVGSAPIQLKLI